MSMKAVLSVVSFLISILLTLSYSSLYAEKLRGVTNDVVKIGIIGDQTGPTADWCI